MLPSSAIPSPTLVPNCREELNVLTSMFQDRCRSLVLLLPDIEILWSTIFLALFARLFPYMIREKGGDHLRSDQVGDSATNRLKGAESRSYKKIEKQSFRLVSSSFLHIGIKRLGVAVYIFHVSRQQLARERVCSVRRPSIPG